jgi:diguanylate cyclase (GGDEF)-like protein/PAS domain S-box-containing protein
MSAPPRSTAETALDAIVTIDEAGTVNTFSAAAERMFGYQAREVIGRNVRMLMPEPFRSEHDAYLERYAATGEAHVVGYGRETVGQRRDGTTFPIHLAIGELRVDATRMFTGVIRDLTAQHAAETAQAESQHRLELLAAEQAALRVVAEAVAAFRASGDVLNLVAEQAARLLDLPIAAVVRFEDGDAVSVPGHWVAPGTGGVSDAPVTDPTLPAQSTVADVRNTGRSSRMGAVRSPTSRLAGAGERLAVPVRAGDELWGCLLVAARKDEAVPAGAEQRLERFADLLTLAIAAADARTALVDRAELLRVRASQQSVLRLVGEHALRLPLDEALVDVAAQVAEPLSAEFVSVCQADLDTLEAVIVSSHGQVVVPVGARAPLSAPLLFNTAMRERTAFVVDDLPADPRFAESPAVTRLGARSAVTVPIMTAAGVWGAMAALSREPAHFDGEDLVFLGAVANIVAAAVERTRMEDELRHRALHDSLTGVANRTLLRDRIGHALGRAQRVGSGTAVIFLDVDHFKDVNDTHGHDVGDALLVAVAARLAEAMRPEDTLARLGGDEFVAVCEDIAGDDEAIAIADRLLAALALPVLEEPRIQVSASAGVVICSPAHDADSALRDADTAMYRAKAAGRGRVEIFDIATRRRLLARIKTRDELDAALERDELLLYYQPVIDLESGAMAAVEGLIRWRHPERGIVGPHAFIPIAEETGQIRDIGRLVIEQACADAARWNALRPDAAALGVSVNLSPRQLGGDGLVGHAKRCVAAAGLPDGQFGLEITETVLLEDNAAHLREIEELRASGIRILLDDFGTGYASLAYLQRFEPDVLKLDRSFVAGLGAERRDTAIVGSVTGMAKALDLLLVAEGVEKREQVASLQLLGCGYAQGYFFARPQPPERIDALRDGMERWRQPPPAEG